MEDYSGGELLLPRRPFYDAPSHAFLQPQASILSLAGLSLGAHDPKANVEIASVRQKSHGAIL